MIGVALAALWLAAGGDVEAGLRALEEGRYEDAARLLEQAPPSYDGLVGLGLACGRLGRTACADTALGRAVALDPGRPEAFVERGGLRFLDQHYDDAIPDLERALRLREDAYARNLLASCLHLSGRPEEALAAWNPLGRPVLRQLEIEGLNQTRAEVARREVVAREGELLRPRDLRETRLRLEQAGVFDRITLRPVPVGEAAADLKVILDERHGFAGSWSELVIVSSINAASQRVRLRYANLAGSGVSLGAQYRWQSTRREVSIFGDWPRPFGWPVYLKLSAFNGRQAYDLEPADTVRHGKGADVAVRRVVGPTSLLTLTLRYRDRRFSVPRPDAAAGHLFGVEAALDRRLLDTHRQKLDGSLRLLESPDWLGSDVDFGRALASLGYRIFLSKPEGVSIEPSVLAARVLAGWGGSRTPLDEMFAVGGSPEMEYPLRGHPQTSGGVLGRQPLARSLLMANVEWRRRILDKAGGRLGFVLFYDGARVTRTAEGSAATFHDIGCGFRMTLGGGPVFRMDFGHGLTDGKNALFIGLGQVF